MSGQGVICHAVLVFGTTRAFDVPALRRDVETAFRATGEWVAGERADDPQSVAGRTVGARFDIFAPAAAGGTVPESEYEEGLDVFAEAYPDLVAPGALISVQVFARDAMRADEPLLSAVLGQIVDLFVDRTEADFVRLPECAGLMTGARFQTELHLAKGVRPGLAPDGVAGDPCRESPRRKHPGAGIGIFPEIDTLEARLNDEWRFEQDPRYEKTSRLDEAEAGARLPIEARLATWTVNASVALLAPPVGASLAVYNLCRGEDFRLNAHALALTGTFISLAASGAPIPSLAAMI
ncbi:MAG: hypothetical protein ACLFRZ_10890 [Rhodosalinus sp.]